MEELRQLFLPDYPTDSQGDPQVGDYLRPFDAMRLAIAEAWRGIGRASPNPMVGCVIVDAEDRFLAKGYHQQVGGPHAEINALAALAGVAEFPRTHLGWNVDAVPADVIEGAKVYVTLEPCSHEGRTPSCARTLAKLPLAEVIYGRQDPNPVVSGRGLAILESEGLRCRSFRQVLGDNSLDRDLNELNEQFVVNMEQKRPFIAMKVAASLDGVFALKSGESQWITNEKSRQFGNFLRGVYDAMLVGRGTIEKDNPALNIRHPFFSGVKKKLVVVDTQGKLLNKPQLKIFKLHDPANLIWAVGESYKGEPPIPVQLIRVPADERGLDLGELHRLLWQQGIRSLYIEAGGKTLSAHLRSQTADRLYLFQAAKILGQQNGRSWSEGFGIDRLSDFVSINQPRRLFFDDDMLMTGRLTYDHEVTEVDV